MNFEFDYFNVNRAEPENNLFFPIQTQIQINQIPQNEAGDDELIKTKDGVIKLRFSSFESLFNLILNTNPMIDDFYKKLKRIEEEGDVKALPHEIIDQELEHALRAGLKRDSVFKTVHALFKRKFPTMAEFYCSVLSVFVKTTLPKALNECLRSGDLTKEAVRLLPYLVCLCRAFFCQSLNLNRMSQIKESASSNLFLEIGEKKNQFLFDRKIELKEFLIMKMEEPKKGTYLHVEIPAKVAKDLKHSVYLEVDRNRIIFLRGGQAILAPGNELFVSYIDEKTPGTKIIKLKMAAKFWKKIEFREDDDEFEAIEGDGSEAEEIETKTSQILGCQ